AVPAERPLMLSSKLNAFVTPTTQNKQIAASTHRDPVKERCATKSTGARPHAICPASFQCALNFQISSPNPNRKIPAAENASTLDSKSPSSPCVTTTTANVTKIPTPPHTGVGATCSRFDDARAIHGQRSASRRIPAVTQAPNASAHSHTSITSLGMISIGL